jgi:hypothetical protein
MYFPRVLSCLTLCGCLGAQAVLLKPKGGGELRIGPTLYRFDLTNLTFAPAKGGLSGAVKLEGSLVPGDRSRPFRMALTVLKDGSLYMLRIDRKGADAYPDTWAATAKTHTRALRLEDRPGGRIDLRCEGPLTGIIAKRPQTATWSGQLWAVSPGGGEELGQ